MSNTRNFVLRDEEGNEHGVSLENSPAGCSESCKPGLWDQTKLISSASGNAGQRRCTFSRHGRNLSQLRKQAGLDA